MPRDAGGWWWRVWLSSLCPKRWPTRHLRPAGRRYSVIGTTDEGDLGLKIDEYVLEVLESLVERVLAIAYAPQLAVEVIELASQRVDFVVKHLRRDARSVRA